MKKIVSFLLLALSLTLACAQDWPNFARYAEANKEVKKAPLAVFMGDSITEGWFGQRKEFFEKNNFVGRGISAQVTSQMLIRFRPDVVNLKPKYVVILAGTNDIAQNQGPISLENVAGNIASMCEIAKANGIIPIICSVLPAHQYKWRKEIEPVKPIAELNEMLKKYAEENDVIYADFYSAVVDERKGLPLKYSPDGVHPNAEGFKAIEPIVLKYIK